MVADRDRGRFAGAEQNETFVKKGMNQLNFSNNIPYLPARRIYH